MSTWITAKLECCSCGNETFPSLQDRDVECGHDGPWWSDGQPPHTCEICSAVLVIEADGDNAYTVEVEEGY